MKQNHNRYLDQHGADINRKLIEQKKHLLKDLLYPQYDDRFTNWSDHEKVLSREEAEWLRGEAYKHLKGDPRMADIVRSRMMHIVGGYFPLGFIGWWDVADKL